MLKERITQLTRGCCNWRLAHVLLGGVALALSIVLALELLMPVYVDSQKRPSGLSNHPQQIGRLLQMLREPPGDPDKVARTIRSGLFRAATGVSDKPMANKVIDRIRSQIKLQCVMKIGGEPVAYVNIEGVGLRKCRVGDSVEGLFTVVTINKRSVETTIIGHKVVFALM